MTFTPIPDNELMRLADQLLFIRTSQYVCPLGRSHQARTAHPARDGDVGPDDLRWPDSCPCGYRFGLDDHREIVAGNVWVGPMGQLYDSDEVSRGDLNADWWVRLECDDGTAWAYSLDGREHQLPA